jgi:hypothetical protein
MPHSSSVGNEAQRNPGATKFPAGARSIWPRPDYAPTASTIEITERVLMIEDDQGLSAMVAEYLSLWYTCHRVSDRGGRDAAARQGPSTA